MLLQLRRSLLAMLVLTVICGLAYPLLETGLAQWWFPRQANGSVGRDGSTLIGQTWKGAQWFHGRPDPDNPMASGPNDLGPASAALAAQVRQSIAAEARLGVRRPPADLVTGSGSGLDPDISPQAALAQVGAVSRARGLPENQLRRLVRSEEQGRQLGFLGEPVVDVLQLNRALARLARTHRAEKAARPGAARSQSPGG
ncbi:MAG: K(+)-transporting ATPase subunit C [Candidatus Dormibacteria bacterium]